MNDNQDYQSYITESLKRIQDAENSTDTAEVQLNEAQNKYDVNNYITMGLSAVEAEEYVKSLRLKEKMEVRMLLNGSGLHKHNPCHVGKSN